ncbi:MAG: GNAT family N-acetyltransferase [Bacteroidales bacterium]|nr:GNAT family N-acetyltransferase [Bacteroidales bacterium]MDY4175740.1 GNAT family N-acetyltransferase [Bacteroidales bacterium]
MKPTTIRLRALEPSDAQTLFEWENDPVTWDAGSRRWPISLADIKALIEHSDLDIWHTRQVRFMIERTDNGETVGCVDIFDFDPLNMHCSVGVLVKHDARRQGFAREAIRQVCTFARETLLANAILATAAADNDASIALFTSAGFSECGRLKGWIRRQMNFVDEVLLIKTL